MCSSACLKISKDPNLHREHAAETNNPRVRAYLKRFSRGAEDRRSPEEGGSDADDRRAPLIAGIPAVVDVSYDPGVGGHHAGRSGGGNAQEVHDLAAQELPDAGAQDLAAISLSVA